MCFPVLPTTEVRSLVDRTTQEWHFSVSFLRFCVLGVVLSSLIHNATYDLSPMQNVIILSIHALCSPFPFPSFLTLVAGGGSTLPPTLCFVLSFTCTLLSHTMWMSPCHPETLFDFFFFGNYQSSALFAGLSIRICSLKFSMDSLLTQTIPKIYFLCSCQYWIWHLLPTFCISQYIQSILRLGLMCPITTKFQL